MSDPATHDRPLAQSATRGAAWVLALRLTQRGAGFLRLLVLTAVLGPEAFGRVGIALLLVESLNTLSQTGFRTALIQRSGRIEGHLDAAWTVLVLRGIALCVLVAVLAPAGAGFFGAPEATPLIRAVGLSILLQSLTNVGVFSLERELRFRRLALHEVSGTLVDLAASIVAAVLLRDAWALVIGMLAGDAMRVATSYIAHPHRPRLRWDPSRAAELFRVGRWLFLSNAFLFLAHQGDDVVVGKALGAGALGLYRLAWQLAHLPVLEVSRAAGQVALPSYVRLRADRVALRRAWLRVVQGTALLSWPIAALVCLLARDFANACLSEAWRPVAPLVEILALHAAVRSLGATAGPVLIAMGRPQVGTALAFVKCCALALVIVPMVDAFGLRGAAGSVLVAAMLSSGAAATTVLRVLDGRASELFAAVFAPLAATAGMASLLIALRTFAPAEGVPGLVAHAAAGALAYALGVLLLGRSGPQPVSKWLLAVALDLAPGRWVAGIRR